MNLFPLSALHFLTTKFVYMPAKIAPKLICILLLWGCGGEEPVPAEDAAGASEGSAEANNISNQELENLPPPEAVEPVESDTEPVEIPDPNGVFLPIYEDNGGKMEMVKMNDHPVYTNGLYFLWTNGSLWKITTKAGSGRTVASGGENLVGSW